MPYFRKYSSRRKRYASYSRRYRSKSSRRYKSSYKRYYKKTCRSCMKPRRKAFTKKNCKKLLKRHNPELKVLGKLRYSATSYWREKAGKLYGKKEAALDKYGKAILKATAVGQERAAKKLVKLQEAAGVAAAAPMSFESFSSGGQGNDGDVDVWKMNLKRARDDPEGEEVHRLKMVEYGNGMVRNSTVWTD